MPPVTYLYALSRPDDLSKHLVQVPLANPPKFAKTAGHIKNILISTGVT